MIVVDTNVISELMKATPSVAVKDWVLARSDRQLFTTSITLAEILYGIERLPRGRRQDLLRSAAEDVFTAFEDQVLSFDRRAAVHYSWIVDTRERRGLPIDGFDAQIASICRTHDAGLATRNVKDFVHAGIDLVDPWRARSLLGCLTGTASVASNRDRERPQARSLAEYFHDRLRGPLSASSPCRSREYEQF